MREIKRILVDSGCKSCKTKQTVLEANFPFDITHLQFFLQNGYTTVKSYGVSGILYIEDHSLIATGANGGNKLQIKCRNDKCDDGVDRLEKLIENMP
jgi:hypothetical protein